MTATKYVTLACNGYQCPNTIATPHTHVDDARDWAEQHGWHSSRRSAIAGLDWCPDCIAHWKK